MDIFWTFYLNHLSPLWGYFLKNQPPGDTNLLFDIIFAKNCMKMKTNGLRSTTGFVFSNNLVFIPPFLTFDVKAFVFVVQDGQASVFFYLGCREVEFMHVHVNLSLLIDSLSEVLASVLKSIRNH